MIIDHDHLFYAVDGKKYHKDAEWNCVYESYERIIKELVIDP